jgi:hypothetical protein
MLLLGLRSEAMVPLVTFAVVLASRGVKFRRGVVIAAVVISSVVIPAIRLIRDVGFSNRSSVTWTEVTPLDTVMELGGSLRAVTAYVDWIDSGDEYLLGASYWAPFDSQILVRVIPGRERIPLERDKRLPGMFMDGRVGPWGASAVGEAYYNFGIAGPFLFLACVGTVFGWLERLAAVTPSGLAFKGLMMFLFYTNIRAAWFAIPAQIGMSVALLCICYAANRVINARTSEA